jgi:hypothetical protein
MNKGKLIIWALSLAFAAYPGVAGAQPDSETARAQLAAASANAIASLKDGIRNEHIRSDLTVGQFIEQTDASAALDQVLESAGPRWIDNQTCQLRLEISGPKLSAALVAIAADRGARSPIPAPQLQQILNEWQKRSFGAVGTSVAADKATRLKPSVAGSHWARVTDDAREQGIARARQNAADHILESIRPIELTAGGQTVGDLLAQDRVATGHAGDLSR